MFSIIDHHVINVKNLYHHPACGMNSVIEYLDHYLSINKISTDQYNYILKAAGVL